MIAKKTRFAGVMLLGTTLALGGLAACSDDSSDSDTTETNGNTETSEGEDSTDDDTSEGSDTDAAGESEGDSAAGGQAAEACAIEEGNLRVYMNPWGPTMTDKFTEDTGIETDDADLGGGEILARIAAEANNPQWDVVVLDGHGSLESLRQQGQLLTDAQFTNLDNLTQEAQDMMPDDQSWIPLSQHAAAVIAYNTDEISEEEAPQTWEDLTDPQYAPIGIADPAIAAPAYPIVSWFFQDLGEDAAVEYFETLNDNGLNTYDKNGPVGNALSTGGIKVAMLQEQNVFELLDAGEPVDFVWPDEGAPAAIRAVAISAETPRPCASATFVDWLTNPENMTYLMEEGENDGIISSFVEGTDTSSLPEERPDDPEFLITDAEFAAENEADIKDWFANLQVR